jgi:site-specific recombinase
MENRIDEISTAEALRVVKSLAAQPERPKFTSANLADMLMVSEEQIVAKVNDIRSRSLRRNFVDRSGMVSAAIAFALLIGFGAARIIHLQPGSAEVTQVTAAAMPSEAPTVTFASSGGTAPASSSTPDVAIVETQSNTSASSDSNSQ